MTQRISTEDARYVSTVEQPETLRPGLAVDLAADLVEERERAAELERLLAAQCAEVDRLAPVLATERERAEKAEAACAAMREALVKVQQRVDESDDCPCMLADGVRAVLASDAGRRS